MSKPRMTMAVIAAFGLSTELSAHALEGDIDAGKQTAQLCVACHQPDGSGMNVPQGESWPSLAGMNPEYLFKQLQDIRDGTRSSPSMLPFVNMLDEEQMRDVSVYYNQLPATAGQGDEETDADTLAHGEKLANAGDWDRYIVPCKSCHGPNNQGAGPNFPGIAGQHAGYIADQLHAWQKGQRNNDPQHLMAAIAERMDDEDIHAVSQWLARQPAQ